MKDTFAAIQRHAQQRTETFRTFIDTTTHAARKADPATGGNECLCLNWGNEASREVWRNGWDRWNRYSKAADARYEKLMRAHLNGA